MFLRSSVHSAQYARERYLHHRSDRQGEGIYEARKLERKSLDILSRLKNFVEEISVETSDTEIDQCIKDHFLNLQSRFS
jgi:hypothetical protein